MLVAGTSLARPTRYLLLLSGLFLGSCNANATHDIPASSITHVKVAESAAVTLGVDPRKIVHMAPEQLFVAFALGPPDDVERAWQAANVSIRSKCMRRSGFTQELPLSAPLGLARGDQQRRNDFLYFDDMDLISEFGYFWPQVTIDSLGDAVETEINDVQFMEALDACNQPIGELLQSVLESHDVSDISLDELDGTIDARVRADTTLDTIYGRWQACMREAGFPDVSLRGYSGTPPKETVQQAVLDARCRVASGYTTAYISLRADAVREWLDANAETAQAFRTAWVDFTKMLATLD